MLVNVNGQICELIKAEAKGGSYHRRVPRKGGKGYTYYYDEDKYAASKNAHLDGPATRSARLTKAVLGAVEGAGKGGCAIKSLRDMAKKEGKEHVAKAIKGCLEKGDLTYKKGMLYRKAMKKAKLELQEKPKEEPKEEKPEKSKRKAMREEPQKKQLKKAEVRLYLDELRKAKGPIGVGKRGGKIYGYDSKGKPIYKPSEVPSKGGKKKPSKPQAQLSLFGQPKLEKPKVEKPRPEPKKEPVKGMVDLSKFDPTKEYRVRSTRTTMYPGKPMPFEVEVYAPEPKKFPWRTHKGGFRSYDEASEYLAEQRKAAEGVAAEKPQLSSLAQKMVRVRELMEADYPGMTKEQGDELYRKLSDAQAGRPGSDIDAAIAEAEALLAKPKAIEHVEEKPKETPATIEIEQEKQRAALGERLMEDLKRGIREQSLRERAAMGHAEAQEQLREYEQTRGPPQVTTEAELEEMKKLWEALPRSGPGWRMITKPWSKQKLKRDTESTVRKIEALPEGSLIRVTEPTGKTIDWQRVAGGKVTLVGLKKETPIDVKYALPGLGGNVLAQVEVKPAKQAPTQAGKQAREEPDAKHDTAEQQAAVVLPEIPPKPPKPDPIPRKEFGAEMRRRWAGGLYSSKNTYPVKEEIKDVGGVWDRRNNTWLLPSQEALDYIEAIIPHKEAELQQEAAIAVSKGLTISGNTYPIRDKIKAAGGKWDGANKQWIMPNEKAAAEIRELMEGKKKRIDAEVASAMKTLEAKSAPERKPKLATEKQLNYLYKLIERNRMGHMVDLDAFGGWTQIPSRDMLSKWSSKAISELIDDLKGGY